MRKLADRHQIRKRRLEVDPEYGDLWPNRDSGQTRRERKSAVPRPGSSLTARMSHEGRTLGGDSSGSSGREGKRGKPGKKGADLALRQADVEDGRFREERLSCAGMRLCQRRMRVNERHAGDRRERRRKPHAIPPARPAQTRKVVGSGVMTCGWFGGRRPARATCPRSTSPRRSCVQ